MVAVTDAGEKAAATARSRPKTQADFTDPDPDPDSRIVKNSDGAYLQAYNAQAVVDEEHQVITADRRPRRGHRLTSPAPPTTAGRNPGPPNPCIGPTGTDRATTTDPTDHGPRRLPGTETRSWPRFIGKPQGASTQPSHREVSGTVRDPTATLGGSAVAEAEGPVYRVASIPPEHDRWPSGRHAVRRRN